MDICAYGTYAGSRLMDINQVIKDLHDERNRLDEVIRSLESLLENPNSDLSQLGAPKRRGRKSMPQTERLAVSKRMRKYWAKRRKK